MVRNGKRTSRSALAAALYSQLHTVSHSMGNRQTDYRAESATTETILADRTVMVYPSGH